MKRQSSNAKIEGIIKKAVTHMVDTELYVWPPACAVFLYQPVRPKRKNMRMDIARRTGLTNGEHI